MKRFLALMLSLVLLCSASLALADDENWTVIEGSARATTPVKDHYDDNPVIEGCSSTTGLAASGEVYTPILTVLDNAETAYPHWGVSKADVLFQIPNVGAGGTKLMALFADQYPELAGGVRSGRATMLPVAMAWGAAFAYAGEPPLDQDSNVNVNYLLSKFGMKKAGKAYNLLGSYSQRESFLQSPHNLSVKIAEIHQNLIEKGTEFEQRPFLFTDDPRTEGADATTIKLLHKGDDASNAVNAASTSTFTWDESLYGYTRTSAAGLYTDRDNGNTVVFNNVIVLRCNFKYYDNYLYLENHLIGSGAAEIFQNGKYIRGAWSREEGGRIVFIDENGDELAFQRGKTFIVITNAVTEVKYY